MNNAFMRISILPLTLALSAVLTFSLDAQELTIIHFNDTHSHLEPERVGEYKGMGGVIERAAYVDSIRTVKGKRNVLLLHAGDFSQGSSYFTQLNGDVEVALLNAVKYDATSLGNHEFDNGLQELGRRVANIKCPVLCANYDFSDYIRSRNFKPYTIIRRAGLKIGIIGLLTPLDKVVDSSISKGLEFLEPAAVVNRLARYLKEKRHCDMVICLSHLGYGADKKLAAATRNVDLIVGGHSHTFLSEIKYVEDLDGKRVPIVQNGCWGVRGAELTVTPAGVE